MDVSVIIPALNEADRIGTAIARAWTAGADEVIVVDGGSTDATCRLAKASRCRLLTSPAGRAAQQNIGAEEARGDVLLFLHADNWLAANGVDQIRDLVCEGQGLGNGTRHGAFQQTVDAPQRRYRWLEWGNAWRVRWRGLPYGDQGIFVCRDTFFAAGGFPKVPLMEDLILMRTLRRTCWPHLLKGPLHVDPRRWERHGVVRQTLRNWSLVTAHDCGVPLNRLANFYRRHDC